MRIALLGNMCSYASNLLPELQQRGHDVELVSYWGPKHDLVDHVGFRSNSYPNARLAERLVRHYALKRKMRRKWDLVLNYVTNFRFNGPEIIYWQGGELFWDADLFFGRPVQKKGYYATPDLAHLLSKDSVLLPRTCSIERFKKAKENLPRIHSGPKNIIIGHFWKRYNMQASYLNRYWKKTDLLESAIGLLETKGYRIHYHSGPDERRTMPSVYRSLDVVAEEFCNLSHGMTAIEAIISGVPVVGTYDPLLVECNQMNKLLINIPQTPEGIAEGIIRAKETRIEDTSEVEQYYSAEHTADVLENTWQRLV